MKKILIPIVVFIISLFLIKCFSDKSEETLILPNIFHHKNELVSKIENRLLQEYVEDEGGNTYFSDTTKYSDFENQDINYSSIQPIFKSNCYFCHRPKGPAPFSLMKYRAVKKKALAISDVIR